MDFTRFKFALPATLAVSTFVSVSACKDEHVYCVDIERQKKCESEPSCQWQNGQCDSVCFTLDNESDCEAIEGCFWEASGGSGSETGDSETGGPAGSCHEPFT
jgi:hypothetical protein